MPAPALILASASPSRRQLLTSAGLVFAVEPSGVDEDEVKRSLLGERARPQDVAETLADAREQLLSLAGQTHELCSSVVVARGGVRLWHCNERARLTMRPLTDSFIHAYLARAGDQVTTSVGAYQLEGLGAHLFSRVDGDYFTILGLPLLPLLSFLADHGIGLEQAA